MEIEEAFLNDMVHLYGYTKEEALLKWDEKKEELIDFLWEEYCAFLSYNIREKRKLDDKQGNS